MPPLVLGSGLWSRLRRDSQNGSYSLRSQAILEKAARPRQTLLGMCWRAGERPIQELFPFGRAGCSIHPVLTKFRFFRSEVGIESCTSCGIVDSPVTRLTRWVNRDSGANYCSEILRSRPTKIDSKISLPIYAFRTFFAKTLYPRDSFVISQEYYDMFKQDCYGQHAVPL